MNHTEIAALSVFMRVAQDGSFTSAARALGISVSSASYTVQRIEQQLGTRLFNRTTRSISLTETGAAFLARTAPLLEQLNQAFAEAGQSSDDVKGTLRLNVPPAAMSLIIAPIFKDFLRAYPEINMDVIVDNSLVDIVKKQYDAGIRYDNVMAQDMVAIPLVTGMKFCIVASPKYLEGKIKPRHPRDLLKHQCTNYRSASTDALYRWEFEKADEKLRMAVAGRIATNDNDLILQAALDGFGFSYMQYRIASPYINAGKLISVLENWIPREALYLYYYNPAGMPRKLRAFIDFAKERLK